MKLLSPERLKLHAFIWLVLAAMSVVSCIAQFSNQSPLQTNLLALLPKTERNAVAEEAVTQLVNSAGNRVLFLVGASSQEVAITAAHSFANQLRALNKSSGQPAMFKQVFLEVPALDTNQIADFYAPYRYRLLTHEDYKGLSDGPLHLSDQLQQKLYAPFRFGLALPVEQDPFGFADRWFSHLPLKNFKLEFENGLLVGHSADKTWVFVSVDPEGSAYSDVTQDQVMHAITTAESSLKQAHPGVELLRAGAVFYASKARQSAEKEMHIIGLVSLSGMLVLLYLMFRSIRPLVLGFLSVGFGICTALAATIYYYGEIHLITLVFGASLIGEAIDYAIQYFSAHLGAGKDWDPVSGLRRVSPALMLALTTSVLGYCVLAFMPFPALTQIAFFAIIGLVAAWLSVYLLLPATLMQPNSHPPEAAVDIPQRFLNIWQRYMTKRSCVMIVLAVLVISVPGLFKLKGNDDIRLLVTQPPELVAQEASIRQITGMSNQHQFFLVEGETTEQLLMHEEALTQQLDQLVARGALAAYSAISTFVPSESQQRKHQAAWQANVFKHSTLLKETLAEAGLRDDIAGALQNDFQHSNKNLNVDDWLKTSFSTPFRHLWLGKTQQGHYASIVLLQGISNPQLLARWADDQNINAVTYVDKAQSVSTLFHTYRLWSAVWLVCAIVLIYGVLSFRYGPRVGLVVLLPTLLGIMFTLGLFGYLHIPLSFFHMMGFMLVLGIGVNYSIFMREGIMVDVKTHQAALLAGVLLSAGTMLLSYGMLILSEMPVLSSFGLTMLMGVGFAALLSLMVLSIER
ncbi:MMPL family transporter [Methylotenera sp. 1P/1]|uniref:MMPL family transporter n=1 Tax=Methylotenera sp. 1P/1 TaxID=1131551 RepID=UPI000374AA63|nr:MMPL family transporter [Methylotenera sp. 1P/1]